MAETKKGAPGCGLYIKVGPDLAMAELVRDLRQIFFVINGSDYEKNMHVVEIRGDMEDSGFRAKAADLCGFIRANGMVCIVRGHPEPAKEIGADGVLVDTEVDIATGRTLFGEDGIVGLFCGVSPERAAAAHDAGVDFVSFGVKGGAAMPSLEGLRFWTMLSEKPALIEGPVTNDYCAYYVQAGAMFVDAGDYIWSHGKGVMQGTVNMLHAIDLALADRNGKKLQ